MTRRRAAPPPRSTVPGLALHGIAAKVEALLEDRARLLREIGKKKQQVSKARAAADQEAQASTLQMQPLVARYGTLVQELSALFDELLAAGRLSKKARKQVLEVRSGLELQGILPPLGDPEETDADEDTAPRASAASDSPGASGKRGRAAPASEHAQREVASAQQPSAERRSLRDLFRSLASAVHPDRARQESERERRTEVMKEVTRAYEAGDFARLIELESAWQSERVLAGDGDPEKRCSELARVNRELLNQVRTLTRELRDVKREARDASLGLLESVLEQAQSELDELAAVRDFVRRFRDGKIPLSDFMRGPSSARASDASVGFALESFVEELMNEAARPRPRRGRSASSKRR